MKLLPIMTLLISWQFSHGQVQIMKKYNFNKGGYYLLAMKAESDYSALANAMGEWYTEDIKILNEFKKEWTFSKTSPMYSCGYHYVVCVCKNGKCLESFAINLNCNEIATDYGYFYFDEKKLSQFQKKVKKAYSKRERFTEQQTARNYLKQIEKDSTLLYTPTPAWTKYEGQFEFRYLCKDNNKDCLDNSDILLKKIKREIIKNYPTEDFELEEVGGSQTELYIRVTCNKSLSDKFNLYSRDSTLYSSRWKAFSFDFETYWTKPKMTTKTLANTTPQPKNTNRKKSNPYFSIALVLVLAICLSILFVKRRKSTIS